MDNLFAAAVGVVVFGALCCGWRAWWIFRTYLPAAGVVTESSYTERMQDDDAPFGRGFYTHGKPGFRIVRDHVLFDDLQGRRRTAWVSRWVSRRYGPDHAYVVWYDPVDAERVTANGPAIWLGFGAAMLALLIGGMVMIAQIHQEMNSRGVIQSSASPALRK